MYPKTFFQDKYGLFWAQKWHFLNSGLALRIFLKFCRMKGANRYMKILLVVFWEKFHLGQFDLFRPFFTVWLALVEIESGHCDCWILKQSGHDLFHDYYWILKQSVTWLGFLSSQDMISQVNMWWILCG